VFNEGVYESIGFIAQELKEVVPEAVTGEEVPFSDEDTPQERAKKTMGVSKDLLIPVLVKALQELKAELDATKAEVAALKGAK
jgi:cell division protein FtsB